MSVPPFQPPPFPGFMPSMPPIPDDIIKIIKEHVDKRLDEIMEGKDSSFRDKFKHYVHEMTNTNHHSEEKEYSEIECLYKKLYELQKCSSEGKSMIEIEKNFHEEMEDLSHEEKRVFSALVRADGPISLSCMIGMSCEDFMKHMKCLGKKIHEHKHKHEHEHKD